MNYFTLRGVNIVIKKHKQFIKKRVKSFTFEAITIQIL
mgnify:CR=1 FL=1